ncbi:hypothetical protein PGTUg99_007574 [Puccinia graminis f. sp. tritici]|uniref:Uncharacterized protein n=1 Tax=Puccinia graminis f. sp. tritici TaxID=56615 RepID=A0A5B0SHW1_PUCGR|nr:hypothetical protein PGTUg99_007574 [Puccinia graminis f. sp. tritici]
MTIPSRSSSPPEQNLSGADRLRLSSIIIITITRLSISALNNLLSLSIALPLTPSIIISTSSLSCLPSKPPSLSSFNDMTGLFKPSVSSLWGSKARYQSHN